MENNHIYIFYGKPQTGKSDLARHIAHSYSTYVIDDFIISPEDPYRSEGVTIYNLEKEIINENIKNFGRNSKYTDGPNTNFTNTYRPRNIIIICNSSNNDIKKFVKLLKESSKFEDYLISLVKFEQGDRIL